MDKERLLKYIEQKYMPKCEVSAKLPLGMNVDKLWKEILSSRYAKAKILPLQNAAGIEYWYTLTDSMITASENIVSELFEHEEKNPATISNIEETYFTGYLEGASISIKEAMTFMQSGEEASDIEELMLLNNRQAGHFAAQNLMRPIDESYLQNLTYILTNGLDNGGGDFRTEDTIEIPSMQNEPYDVPSAAKLPGMLRNFIAYLSNKHMHPLIKAAVAQAWVLIVRPFPEGNERLARLLSTMILIRAGYTFFSEISISSLIVQRGYDYFQAIANVIRMENGRDLTYFIEYYLNILSDGVDLLKEKRKKEEADVISSEHKLAKVSFTTKKKDTASAQVSNPGIIENGEVLTLPTTDEAYEETKLLPFADPSISDTDSRKKMLVSKMRKLLDSATSDRTRNILVVLLKMIDEGRESFTRYELIKEYGFDNRTISLGLYYMASKQFIRKSHRLDDEFGEYFFAFSDQPDSIPQLMDNQTFFKQLEDMIENGLGNVPVGAKALKKFIEEGKYTFTTHDLINATGLSMAQVQNIMYRYRYTGIVFRQAKILTTAVYRFGTEFNVPSAADAEKSELDLREFTFLDGKPFYETDIFRIIDELAYSARSSKDRRISAVIKDAMKTGIISFSDPPYNCGKAQFKKDMNFAYELGLVDYVSTYVCRIRSAIAEPQRNLKDGMKNALTKMYDLFGDNEFSHEMVFAKLNYSSGQLSAYLHKFTWMKFLDCHISDENRFYYQFKVNPVDNPECFQPDSAA